MPCNRAGVEPGDLCAVQAHATGTSLGDLAEARALRRSLDAAADHIPVFAPKGQLGHLLGAAGAVEAILGIQALHKDTCPEASIQTPSIQRWSMQRTNRSDPSNLKLQAQRTIDAQERLWIRRSQHQPRAVCSFGKVLVLNSSELNPSGRSRGSAIGL